MHKPVDLDALWGIVIRHDVNDSNTAEVNVNDLEAMLAELAALREFRDRARGIIPIPYITNIAQDIVSECYSKHGVELP